MAFTPDGQIMYSVGGDYSKLKVTNMSSMIVTKLGQVGPENVRGLCFGGNGNLYYVSDDGDVGIVNVATGIGSKIGATGVGTINDLAPVIASTELKYAQVTLDISAGAIDNDDDFSLSLETTELMGGVSVTFGPHGTIFNQPAILNLTAHGVDFSGVDPNAINIYYDNQETGVWEPMERDDLIIDVNAGTIQVINAQLPHFSRYAVGGE
jgi:WD40 repeat protein